MFEAVRLKALLKHEISLLLILFFLAETLQSTIETRNVDGRELPSIQLPLEDLRNKLNNSSFVNISSPVNSSVILDTNSTGRQNREDSTQDLELLHILKQRLTFYFAEKQSFVSSMLIIIVATISVFLYFTLVLWRRRLQKIYGNRECLVPNEVLNEKNPTEYA